MMGIGGWVGNGDGVTMTGINVNVGIGFGETTTGTVVSAGNAPACPPQAVENKRITIQKYRLGFVVTANLLS